MSIVSMVGAAFCLGVIVGVLFGPATERLHSAHVDGWLAGYSFAARHPDQRDVSVADQEPRL